jgi:hypothetical protein
MADLAAKIAEATPSENCSFLGLPLIVSLEGQRMLSMPGKSACKSLSASETAEAV